MIGKSTFINEIARCEYRRCSNYLGWNFPSNISTSLQVRTSIDFLLGMFICSKSFVSYFFSFHFFFLFHFIESLGNVLSKLLPFETYNFFFRQTAKSYLTQVEKKMWDFAVQTKMFCMFLFSLALFFFNDNKVKWKCTFHIMRKIEFGLVYYETFLLGTQFLVNLKIPRKMSWSDALCMFNGTKWKRIRWKRFVVVVVVVVNVIIYSLQFAFHMLWHIKCHVYPIDRACCALNATAKIPNTSETIFSSKH